MCKANCVHCVKARMSYVRFVVTHFLKAAEEIIRSTPSYENTFWTSLIDWLKDREKSL